MDFVIFVCHYVTLYNKVALARAFLPLGIGLIFFFFLLKVLFYPGSLILLCSLKMLIQKKSNQIFYRTRFLCSNLFAKTYIFYYARTIQHFIINFSKCVLEKQFGVVRLQADPSHQTSFEAHLAKVLQRVRHRPQWAQPLRSLHSRGVRRDELRADLSDFGQASPNQRWEQVRWLRVRCGPSGSSSSRPNQLLHELGYREG